LDGVLLAFHSADEVEETMKARLKSVMKVRMEFGSRGGRRKTS